MVLVPSEILLLPLVLSQPEVLVPSVVLVSSVVLLPPVLLVPLVALVPSVVLLPPVVHYTTSGAFTNRLKSQKLNLSFEKP